jgi:hypothetical protein
LNSNEMSDKEGGSPYSANVTGLRGQNYHNLTSVSSLENLCRRKERNSDEMNS